MKRATLATLVLAFSLPLIGQSNQTLIANIPFSFELGNKVMPAGEYRVNLTTSWYPVVQLTSTDLKHSTFVMTGSKVPAPARRLETYLSFNRYEDRHFLADVAFLDRNYPVTKSKNERALVTSRLVKTASAQPVEVRIMAAAR